MADLSDRHRLSCSIPQPPILVLLAGLAACGPRLREVRLGAIPPNATPTLIQVDQSPPPAEIERIPEAPASDCDWASGYYDHKEGIWEWQHGHWIESSSCFRSKANLVWVPSPESAGALFYSPPTWYNDSGESCPSALQQCGGKAGTAATKNP